MAPAMQTGLKRAMDVLGAAASLAVLSLPMILIAVLVRYNMGRPVLFRHVRPGLNGKPFTLFKFRTMCNVHNPDGSLDFSLEHPDRDRITPLGGWLRSTSLDELPSLFNVLKGDMSLVGPRPLLMEYLDEYSVEQARRHDVRPGLTGWAQVNGRAALSWEEKLELDVWYVDNRSFWLDLKILAITVGAVLRRDGINSKGYTALPTFYRRKFGTLTDENERAE
jgi:lipopolysaccharide/colanic/teichoic acid biosynthesis glycosyltransferase